MRRINKNQTCVLKKVNDINPCNYRRPPMEVINKNHEEISVKKKFDNLAYFSITNNRHINFSAKATEQFGMKSGRYVHFINDGDDWLFYTNNDPDGFKIIPCNKNYSALICSRTLIQLFLKRTRCSIPVKFPINPTKIEKDGNKVTKIEINQPL